MTPRAVQNTSHSQPPVQCERGPLHSFPERNRENFPRCVRSGLDGSELRQSVSQPEVPAAVGELSRVRRSVRDCNRVGAS
jgi:hypothetical protein